MQNSNKYMDLVYFGYDHFGEESINSRKNQTEFMETLKERFPDVEFKDAYDEIKGFRQEVFLSEDDKESYYSWIFAFGWYECSLTTSILTMSPEKKDEVKKYIDIAKKEYTQNFKS
jgi:hypothetical protein